MTHQPTEIMLHRLDIAPGARRIAVSDAAAWVPWCNLWAQNWVWSENFCRDVSHSDTYSVNLMLYILYFYYWLSSDHSFIKDSHTQLEGGFLYHIAPHILRILQSPSDTFKTTGCAWKWTVPQSTGFSKIIIMICIKTVILRANSIPHASPFPLPLTLKGELKEERAVQCIWAAQLDHS